MGNFNISKLSTVNVGGTTHAHNYPPEPAPIDMPAIDFDSSDPDSLKNRASVVYTQTEFNNLIEAYSLYNKYLTFARLIFMNNPG